MPFRYFRAGMVFHCPHCNGSFVPTLSMVRAVERRSALPRRWTATFEDFHERRRRELEQFEERQRRDAGALRGPSCAALATREKAPGRPREAEGFFSF